jgi:hypothetical protein
MDVSKADYMIGVDMARRQAKEAQQRSSRRERDKRPKLRLKVPLSVLPLVQDADNLKTVCIVQKINHV